MWLPSTLNGRMYPGAMWIWTVLLWTFTILLDPVRAECDPSHAVVAVASILSTLVVVALVLVGVYFFLKRRKAHNLPRSWEQPKVVSQGEVNNAFFDNDEFVIVADAERGSSPHKRKGQTNAREPILARGNKDNKTWSSLPRTDKTGRLYREGSCGSLDENITYADPETVSVTLESQDIIGLGFNICGGYGEGIRVSEVHNRGPAKESGEIKVGDRILSVTVSYENIVYEDALTILSYASPYPVKIVLEKATDRSLKHFVDRKPKDGGSRRLAHPLYRSQSMDTLKTVSSHKAKSHPKRANSEMKIESGKGFMKWRNKHSKKNHDLSPQEGVPSSKKAHKSGNERPYSIESTESFSVEREIIPKVEREIIPKAVSEKLESVHFSKQEGSCAIDTDKSQHSGNGFKGSPTKQVTAEVLAPSDIDLTDDYLYQRSPPDKPERKNRKKSDSQIVPNTFLSGFEDDVIVASTTAFSYSLPPSARDDDNDADEIEEETIVPETVKRGSSDGSEAEESEGPETNVKDISGALEILNDIDFVDYVKPSRSPSPDGDPVEEEPIVPTDRSENSLLSAMPPSSDHPELKDLSMNNDKNAEEKGKQKPSSPLLDEETLERIIAMNAFTPGTQGWAGVHAGGNQGGVIDDFVPNNPFFTAQPVPRPHGDNMSPDNSKWGKPAGNNVDISADTPLNNNRGLAYEIRDDFVTGKPYAVEINKHKHVMRTGSAQFDSPAVYPDTQNIKAAAMRTSSSFDRSVGLGDGSSVTVGLSNDGSENSDTLEWSGQRLVRSESFSNIFVNE